MLSPTDLIPIRQRITGHTDDGLLIVDWPAGLPRRIGDTHKIRHGENYVVGSATIVAYGPDFVVARPDPSPGATPCST